MPDAGTAASVATTNRQFNQNQVYPSWEYDLLRTLGGNSTNLPNSLLILSFWAKAEGVKNAANNWLAVTAPPQEEAHVHTLDVRDPGAPEHRGPVPEPVA